MHVTTLIENKMKSGIGRGETYNGSFIYEYEYCLYYPTLGALQRKKPINTNWLQKIIIKGQFFRDQNLNFNTCALPAVFFGFPISLLSRGFPLDH